MRSFLQEDVKLSISHFNGDILSAADGNLKIAMEKKSFMSYNQLLQKEYRFVSKETAVVRRVAESTCLLHWEKPKEISSLTFKRNRSICKMRVFSFPQTEQGGREERVVDEILHVVVLALLFGFSAHLVRHVLPVGTNWISLVKSLRISTSRWTIIFNSTSQFQQSENP